jgi:hypothetical protein
MRRMLRVPQCWVLQEDTVLEGIWLRKTKGQQGRGEILKLAKTNSPGHGVHVPDCFCFIQILNTDYSFSDLRDLQCG